MGLVPFACRFEWDLFHSHILCKGSLFKGEWEQELVLWATMPSPDAEIRRIVGDLFSLCELSPAVVPLCSRSPWVVPLSYNYAPLPSNHLYVGAGCKAFPIKPSQWLNPFSSIHEKGLELYKAYVNARPDRGYFLSPIARAATLVCDCASAPCTCHAHVLAEMVVQQEARADSSWCESYQMCYDCTDPDDVLDTEVDAELENCQASTLENVNETLRAVENHMPSAGPGFPRIWTKLIAQVRSFQVMIFWEIFAGSAVLTECMKETGWQCGMPVDVLYHPDLNVLNPMFLAVLVGLVLEGRVGVLHLAPPCSSFSMAVNRFAG